MNEEEFFNRIINKIAKDYGYDVASTLELMFFKKEKQLEAYENMKKEAKKYIEEHIVYETDDCINGMQFCSYHLYDFSKGDLLNILNKVGGSDD